MKLLAPERHGPQYKAVLAGKEAIGKEAAFHVEAGKVSVNGAVLNPLAAGFPTGKGYIQAGTGERDRRPGKSNETRRSADCEGRADE